MSTLTSKLAAVAAMVVVIAAAPLALDTRAHADEQACLDVLEQAGHEIEQFARACAERDFEDCAILLLKQDVTPDVTIEACQAAADDES
jgi:hypothetical protein